MGNICTNSHEKQETTETVDSRNSIKISVSLGNHCSIDLITGNFRQYKSDCLLIITQSKGLEHCEPLRQFCSQPQKIEQVINSQRKMFYKASVNRLCPYKKICFAILPKYCTQQSQQYQQHFKNILKEVFSNSKDITVDTSSPQPNASIYNVQRIAINQKQCQNQYDYKLKENDESVQV